MVDNLGGRDGVERLIGSLDDLLIHCVEALNPLDHLSEAASTLQERINQLQASFPGQDPNLEPMPTCDARVFERLRVCIIFS